MQYIYRCVLDVDDDVVRDIAIDSKMNLQDFHEAIINAFRMNQGEMAAFYKSNDDWEQGEEIPLFEMNDMGLPNEMKDFELSEFFLEIDSKALYVYDFLKMWTFFVELKQIDEDVEIITPKIVYNKGEVPEKSPEKKFESLKMVDDFEEEFNDEFGSEFDEDYDENPNDFY